MDELDKIIHLLDDQKFYNEMVENGKKSASKYLITAANSSKKLYNLLSNFDFNKTLLSTVYNLSLKHKSYLKQLLVWN